ncbi:hypothetical protein ACHAQH_005451 [Verticillium albo-atrum]
MGVHKQTARVAQHSPSPRRNHSRRSRQSGAVEPTHPAHLTQVTRITRSKVKAQHPPSNDNGNGEVDDEDGDAEQAQTPTTTGVEKRATQSQESPVTAAMIPAAIATTPGKPTHAWQSRSFLISDDSSNGLIKEQKLLAAKALNETSTGPAWDSPLVTYYNWVAIMSYAAASDSPTGLEVNWLLDTARSCSLLAGPALDVLYRCPPLTNDHKARSLVALLARPPSLTYFNYRTKIRVLCIDTGMVTIHPQTSVSPFSLMQNLINLEEIKLVHSSDDPPFRRRAETIRWQYPKELFEALGVAPDADADAGDKKYPTHLKGFYWNSRMMKRSFVDRVEKIKEIHTLPTFAYIRKIGFSNFQIPSWSLRSTSQNESDEAVMARDLKDQEYSRSVAACLSSLKELEHLTFQSSSVVNASLLQHLPQKLKHLKIVNCWDVWSTYFANFLRSHGRHLESLILDHNQSLNLSFLTVLGVACPNLRELHMNLRYFRHYDACDDSDPLYETLLFPEQVPTWPASLQLIEFDNLRQWTVESATSFFQSLVDSARNLPMLRYLVVRCMLDIPWKTRSEFRQAWEPRLNKVFLRPKTSPLPPTSATTRIPAKSTTPKKPRKARKLGDDGPARQSGRIASKDSERSSRASSAAKALRSIKRRRYEEPDSDEFDHEDSSDVDMDASDADASEGASNKANFSPSTSDEVFVQGLCTVVEIKLDNQKPREQQFAMEDFLDFEDGDEDTEWDAEWDGQDDFE